MKKQIENCRARITALESERNRLHDLHCVAVEDVINSRKADKETRGCLFKETRADADAKKRMKETGAELDAIQQKMRIEELVMLGLIHAHLNRLESDLLEMMLDDVEKLDGQKAYFKKPERMVKEYAEKLGTRAYVSDRHGRVSIYEPCTNETRDIYVCDGRFEKGEFVYRFSAEDIRKRHEDARNREILTEDEIRVLAVSMIEDVHKIRAEKDALTKKIDATKESYRRAFGYTAREIEDL